MTLKTSRVEPTTNVAFTEPSRRTTQRKATVRRHKRDRHTRRIVVGLTGVLGFAWIVVIAGRYSGLIAG